MADVLKETLYCASGEAHTLNAVTGASASTAGTQANLKDTSDSTGSKLQVTGDDIDPGGANYREEWTLDSLVYSGDISFIRIKGRHDFDNTGAGGDPAVASYRPSINGTSRGSTANSTAAVQENSQDFTTDPADSNPWTQAKINAQKFGWYLEAQTASTGSDDTSEEWVREYKVEVWGPDTQTVTPDAVTATASVPAATVVPGAVTVEAAAVSATGSVGAPTLVPGAVTVVAGAVSAAASVPTPADADNVADSFNPTTATTQALGVGTYYIRRATGDLGDLDDNTGVADASPASWPTGTGTELVTQNIAAGPSLPELVISHVVFCARGVTTQDGNYLSNLRAEISGGSYPLSPAFPDVQPYAGAASLVEQVSEARSANVASPPAGGAWTWAALTAYTNITIKVDRANITTVGHLAEIYVSEIWIEVYGPQGINEPPLVINQPIGNYKRNQKLKTTI